MINDAIDLAIIATPANTVGEIIKQCGEHGIKVIVLSVGFSETGARGKRMEKDMMELIHHYGMHLIGLQLPRCDTPLVGFKSYL